MKTKNILIVRMSKKFQDLCEEEYSLIDKKIKEVFKKSYLTLIIIGENETDKTTFEIIKHEN
jgi:hypothetical protein